MDLFVQATIISLLSLQYIIFIIFVIVLEISAGIMAFIFLKDLVSHIFCYIYYTVTKMMQCNVGTMIQTLETS